MPEHGFKAIITDTGGTVCDWHSAVKQAFSTVAQNNGLSLDAGAITNTWRKLSMGMVSDGLAKNAQGRVEMDMEDVLRVTLDQTLQEHDQSQLSTKDKAFLVHSWRNMRPWSDIPQGVERLRKGLTVCPFTILKTASIIQSSRATAEDPRHVEWDCIISCEMVGEYKPRPITYHTAAKWLGLPKENVLLVASHNNDLKAGAMEGFKTAYIRREKEWGDMKSPDATPDKCCTYVAEDFEDLATQLGL